MRRISYVVASCVILAAFLALDASFNAGFAEEKATDEAPYSTERQALREESAAIRADHDALEVEREKLKTQCLDVKGQDKSNCDIRREKLHEKRVALRERVKTLVDKIHADKAHGHKMIAQHDGSAIPNRAVENPSPDELDPPVSMEPVSK